MHKLDYGGEAILERLMDRPTLTLSRQDCRTLATYLTLVGIIFDQASGAVIPRWLHRRFYERPAPFKNEIVWLASTDEPAISSVFPLAMVANGEILPYSYFLTFSIRDLVAQIYLPLPVTRHDTLHRPDEQFVRQLWPLSVPFRWPPEGHVLKRDLGNFARVFLS